jgi:hypothetical protein
MPNGSLAPPLNETYRRVLLRAAFMGPLRERWRRLLGAGRRLGLGPSSSAFLAFFFFSTQSLQRGLGEPPNAIAFLPTFISLLPNPLGSRQNVAISDRTHANFQTLVNGHSQRAL